jgi:uracil phosphoribosyltransferase
MIHILGKENSILNNYIYELRSSEIQKDRMRFRRNIERIGQIFAYEISKHLKYVTKKVDTPLGTAEVSVIDDQPVVITILRAGLPLHRGITDFFDQADNAFIGAFREHQSQESFNIRLGYVSSPSLMDRTVILCDPMLATGASLVLSYQELLKMGKPAHTHIVSVIASTTGLDFIQSRLKSDVTFWLGAVDKELTKESYIFPGLGDAGDLAFGLKL